MIVVYPYIKPQLCPSNTFFPAVVYLLTPTSNHNLLIKQTAKLALYIFWLLHQTTTRASGRSIWKCCISFDSYIKPQLYGYRYFTWRRCISFDSYIKPQLYRIPLWWHESCISFDSYIKPQLIGEYGTKSLVVYLLTPTSNHNLWSHAVTRYGLYIFWLLHQTTTIYFFCNIALELYIFWLLHQTTTPQCLACLHSGCISFDSYIKPQLVMGIYRCTPVVYLLTPTSNHNCRAFVRTADMLYIFWLLHQTTTAARRRMASGSCISFDSYIKPQLACNRRFSLAVVYLLTPTSNHNVKTLARGLDWLYIFWLLHQTTTKDVSCSVCTCCISFDSYIKPQPVFAFPALLQVVYLLTPTSNHNSITFWLTVGRLYIFWLLHQTTT